MLTEVFEDDLEACAALVMQFRRQSRVALAQLEHAIEAGDGAGARQIAHALKGSSAAVGAERLSRAAADLGRHLAAGDLHVAAGVQVELQRTFDLTDDALRTHVTEPPLTPRPAIT
jgi:HPt (histidine-containing phosphotransfer) domain-containing protein